VSLTEDIEQLEKAIRRLQIEWDKFFSGIEKKPPSDLKSRVEGLIRQHAFGEIRNNAERFRYQGLTARYNTLNELWSKRLRAKEEGKAFGVHGLKADALPVPPQPSQAPAAPVPAPPARPGAAAAGVRLSDPQRDAEAVRALYEGFVQARRKAGETAPVRFESFQKLVTQQASRILGDRGAQAVDFRLETKDGKVSLKARVVK
jgi:hypothetical protein